MTRRVLLLASLVCALSCQKQKDSFIVLHTDVNCDVPRVYQLRITITNDGLADQKTVPETPSAELGFPSSLVLDLASSRSGVVQLVIEAIDDKRRLIGQGTASGQIDQGNSLDIPIQIAAVTAGTVVTTQDAGGTASLDGGVAVDEGPATKTDALATTSGTSGIPFLQVAAGTQSTCGVRTDGSLWCWGDNTYGQLRLSGSSSRLTPSQLLGASSQHVACGQTHCCGLRTDGTLSCWGYNGSGQLGSTPVAQPGQQVDVAGAWLEVATGSYQSCGIKSDFTLWCWGDNTNGQLGNGGADTAGQPTQVAGDGWKQVSSGYLHTCAVKQGGTLWCWGLNANLQLGDAQYHPSPSQVAGSDWLQVATGLYHTCATRTDGSLLCWGGNISGQLGNAGVPVDPTGATSKTADPVLVAGTWSTIAAGQSHTCGIQPDKSLWCWGDNTKGQLGDNTLLAKSEPNQVVVAGQTWEQVAAGAEHTCAMATGGAVWCWGANLGGQLGLGSSGAPKEFPARVVQ
jgi:alpha-tubulin suppressor-like RCC1 family protein